MGAAGCIETTNLKTEKEVRKWVASETLKMEAEKSGLYCGNWSAKEEGVNFLSKTFTNFQEACDFIAEHNDKWGPVDACRVTEKQGTDAQNKRIELQKKKVSEAYSKIFNFQEEWVTNLQGRTTKRKTCKECSATIPVHHIRTPFCPHCRKSLLSPTQTKKLEKIKENWEKEERKYKEMVAKRGGKTLKYWVVGGSCPS